MLNTLLLIHNLRVEGDTDANPGVVLYASALLFVRIIRILTSVCPALNDKPTMARRYKAFEDGSELLRHLLECSLNSFILTLIKMRNKFLDRLLRLVEFRTTLEQLILLVGKAVVLFESLLVDMLVFLERIVDFLETGSDLKIVSS